MGTSSSSHLRKPSVEKTTFDGKFTVDDHRVLFGCMEQQGWRKGMEDALSVYREGFANHGRIMFAVFDGHGGASTAKYCAQHLGSHLWADIEANDGQITEKLLQDSFLEFDLTLLKTDLQKNKHIDNGATATVVIVDTRKKQIHFAHLGDSRGMLMIHNPRTSVHKTLYITRDHAPDLLVERQRIARCAVKNKTITVRGNRVIYNNFASLNLSRAFGDFLFKGTTGVTQAQQAVSPFAEYWCTDYAEWVRTGHEIIFMIASDGIWGSKFTGKTPYARRPTINDQMELYLSSQVQLNRTMIQEAMKKGVKHSSRPHNPPVSKPAKSKKQAAAHRKSISTFGTANPGAIRDVRRLNTMGALNKLESKTPAAKPPALVRRVSAPDMTLHTLSENAVEAADVASVCLPAPYSVCLAKAADNLIATYLTQFGKSTDNMAAILVTISNHELAEQLEI